MKTVNKFCFATIVCDGCAGRVDSTIDDEFMYDYDDLTGWVLEWHDWQHVKDDKWYCPACAKDPGHRTYPGEGREIVEVEPLFGLKCDHCGREWEDTTIGYAAFEDFGDAEVHANDDGWQEIEGKWYCPDCYQTCKAMSDESDGVENWEEVYCSKCKYKDDCNEIEPRDIPYPDHAECNRDCPYRDATAAFIRCKASAGAKCPRVEEWKNEGIAKQEAANAKALEECGKTKIEED